jgi:hypothetical protein
VLIAEFYIAKERFLELITCNTKLHGRLQTDNSLMLGPREVKGIISIILAQGSVITHILKTKR